MSLNVPQVVICVWLSGELGVRYWYLFMEKYLIPTLIHPITEAFIKIMSPEVVSNEKSILTNVPWTPSPWSQPRAWLPGGAPA